MQTSEIIALISLVVSSFVAYKTFVARFKGKIWPSISVVLTMIDKTPSIGLACFAENLGARPGRLDDMRLSVKHVETDLTYMFFPQLVRDDYNIFAPLREQDWFPYSGLLLLGGDKIEKYILFRPLNDDFKAKIGNYQVVLEIRWKDGKWERKYPEIPITLNSNVAASWNTPDAQAIQVFSNDMLARRKEEG